MHIEISNYNPRFIAFYIGGGRQLHFTWQYLSFLSVFFHIYSLSLCTVEPNLKFLHLSPQSPSVSISPSLPVSVSSCSFLTLPHTLLSNYSTSFEQISVFLKYLQYYFFVDCSLNVIEL